MRTSMVRLARQPQVAVATAGPALLVATATWRLDAGALAGARTLILAAALTFAVVAAYRFPIYIRHNTKMCVISIPLFLMASLLSPALAVIAAMAAMLAGELAVKAQRGTFLSDIATNVGRWTFIVLAGCLVAHITVPASGKILRDLPLLGAAIVLWLGDALTLPLVLVPITGERPWRIIETTVREGGAAEAALYLMGILGVLLAMQQVWAVVMLLVPAGLVYIAYKKEVDTDSFRLLEGLADIVDLRDPYTGGHSRRVAGLVEDTLRELGMTGAEAAQIITAARLHDIGKIGLPDYLLLKPGALTDAEWERTRSYLEQADDLLRGYPDFARGLEMVLHHHEHWDGSGYPDGLAGTDIPFGARVIAVCDSFDAMISARPYREAMTPDRAAEILRDGRGAQWDAAIVDAFLRSIADRLEHPIAVPRGRITSASSTINTATPRLPA